MADFETVIGRLQQAEGLDRGAAIARLKELNDAGQVPKGKVPDLESNLSHERVKSLELIPAEFLHGLAEFPETVARRAITYAGYGSSLTPKPRTEQMLEDIQSRVEPLPKYVGGASELVGSAAMLGGPFEAGEAGLEALPWLAGKGFIKTSVRRGLTAGLLGYTQTGDIKQAGEWAKYGVILPPAIEAGIGVVGAVSHVIGQKLSDLLSRAGEDADVEPEFRHVEEEQKLLTGPKPPPPITGPLGKLTPEEIVGGKYAPSPSFVAWPPETRAYQAPEADLSPDDVPLGPVDKPTTSISGETVPWAPPQGGSVLNPIARQSAEDPSYVGTQHVTTGQSFEGTRTVRLQEGTYVNATHPAADLGKPWPVSLDKPAVIKVGSQPYRDALAKIFPNSPKLLELYDASEEPDKAAREILGRYATQKKFDGVILKSDDMSKDIILDYRDFKSTKTEGVGKDLSAEVRSTKLDKSLFARVLKGDEPPKKFKITPNNPLDIPGYDAPFHSGETDPYIKVRALKVKGKIYPGKDFSDFHETIADRHGIQMSGMSGPDEKAGIYAGFIGHDDKFYEKEDMERRIDAYERRYGQARSSEKVNFSELVGFNRMLPGVMYDLAKPEDLHDVVESHGFRDAKSLAQAIRRAKFTPFEMLQNMAKAQVEPPPITRSSLLVTKEDAKAVSEPLQALANRYPKLTGVIHSVQLSFAPDAGWLARTGLIHGTNNIGMEINTAFLPNKPSGIKSMAYLGLKPGQENEFVATTLEHELAHVAQFWLDDRKLSQAFGSPSMAMSAEDDPRIEAQAENRDRALQQYFENHENLRQQVAQVPEEVRVAALKAHGAEERAKLKPIVRRRFNQLSNTHTVRYFDRKIPKPTAADFEDMDGFDSTSRSGPIDSQIDPDLYYSPELKSMLGAMQKAGMKWGGWFSSIRNAWDVSDNEDHLWYISRVFQEAQDMHVNKAKFNKRLANIFTEYGAEDKNYDKLWEAAHGLRRASDGSLSQTLSNVDPKTAKAAVKLRDFNDSLYEYAKKIDRKAPAILAGYNLPDTPDQWWRLKKLQTGLRAQVKNPTLDEFEAAKKMEGMLNFDESTDLRGEYVDGYLTHQPIANERTELLNQIDQVDKIAKLTGVTDPTGQALRAARIKRLAEIELDLAKAYVRSGPRTDVLPKNHYFGPMVVKDHPGAASVLVDKNIPQIAGRYTNGVVSKVYFDKILHEFSKIAPTLPGSVRDYDIHYTNNLRGLRGYNEDVGMVNFINDVQKQMEKLGIKLFNRVGINDVRKYGELAVKIQTFTKLLMTPIRFPAIQSTHLIMTTGVVSPEALLKGFAYFFSHPKIALEQVMERGIVERDADFLGAMDSITPTTQGKLMNLAQKIPTYADYLRKGVTWHGFRLQAMKPGFKFSPLAKTFIKDVPGRSVIETANQYADAMTDRTQFRLRAEGKPTAFVGGQVRRAITQFKPWMVNYGTFFKDVAKSGDVGMQARLLAALYFVGGPTAVLGGDLVYNYARTELIKHFGYVLPNDTGFQQIANMLGWGSIVGDVDLLSLRSPIGVPSDPENVLPWLAGPTLGTLWDIDRGISDAKGDTGKEIKSTISAISPEARALIDAGEEWRQGGVKSPMGEILAKRPTSSIIIRGLDLSPSVKSQRYNYRNDIVTALQSGHPDTARQLLAQAKSKGIIFGPKDMGQIRATVKHYLKGQKLYERDPESALR